MGFWRVNSVPLWTLWSSPALAEARERSRKGEASLSVSYMLGTSEGEAAGFPGVSSGKEFTCQCRRHETWVPSLGREDPLEKGMATHTSILAWEIPRTEEPVGLQSRGSKKSRTLLRDTCTQTCVININYYIDPQNGPVKGLALLWFRGNWDSKILSSLLSRAVRI